MIKSVFKKKVQHEQKQQTPFSGTLEKTCYSLSDQT